MAKKWKYVTSNYREAWNSFRKTDEYKIISETLLHKGIKQPYRNNILKTAFAAGWNAGGAKTKLI